MQEVTQAIARVHADERAEILASLIRVCAGDFDAAEEVLQDAFAAAVEQWPRAGVPERPAAWIGRAARNKAIDALRRRARFEERREAVAAEAAQETPPAEEAEDAGVADDRLRLIFTCCHPALPLEAQVALTLRTLCGLSTEAIAHAFLVPPATMAQRIVRAKAKIKGARIPYRVPPAELLAERLEAVLAVVYLVFTEGYATSAGGALVERTLCAEAIRLARLLAALMPAEREPRALLALMLLHDARRDARVTPAGDLVLLDEQDRARWDRAQIDEGCALVEEVLGAGPPSAYAVQAAVAALHGRAPRAEETDWAQIAYLYDVLARIAPSPVVSLNHAVAVAMHEGPERGLALLEGLEALEDYHLLHAARGDLLRRLGRRAEASEAYERARALAPNDPERRFLERRLRELGT
jgi:RNA polymerase sigma-70 factor (ECF subfamily)